MPGIICPKCGKVAQSVADTVKVDGAVDRYRRCECGRSVPTREYPKAFVQNLIRMVNGTKPK